MAGFIGKIVPCLALRKLEPTPEPTLGVKAAGYERKAAGYEQKAAGYEQKAPGFGRKVAGF